MLGLSHYISHKLFGSLFKNQSVLELIRRTKRFPHGGCQSLALKFRRLQHLGVVPHDFFLNSTTRISVYVDWLFAAEFIWKFFSIRILYNLSSKWNHLLIYGIWEGSGYCRIVFKLLTKSFSCQYLCNVHFSFICHIYSNEISHSMQAFFGYVNFMLFL